MKAVRVEQWGGSDAAVITEIERPQPGPGEILVRVKATSINPFDWSVREGYLQNYLSLPLTLGSDFAGDIEAVGDGVVGFEAGSPVYGMKGIRGGAFAEYTTVLANDIAKKPETLSYLEAAVVPHAAVTAWGALFTAGGLQKGQRILIHAAAGGVGHFAVQFAKSKGAYVIGTASAQNEVFLRELGVDEFVDYQTTPFETVVKDVDVVLDTVGFDTAERSCQVIKPGGMLVCIVTPPPGESVAKYGIQAAYSSGQMSTDVLTEIGKLIDAGQVKAHISHLLKFDQIHEGLQLSQGRHGRGKISVAID